MADRVRLQLRLPAQLHQSVRELAAKSRRSLNGQLVYLLETHPEVMEMAATERLAPEQAWQGYVGSQTVREFVEHYVADGITDIDEMVRAYVADIPAMLDVEADDLPADLADLLAGYIRRWVESQARQLANERLLDCRDAIERGEAEDYTLTDRDIEMYFEFERWLDVPEGRRAFREEWERGAREMTGALPPIAD